MHTWLHTGPTAGRGTRHIMDSPSKSHETDIYSRPRIAPDDNDPPAPVLQLMTALRAHCADHPNAVDTVEGVRRWWLGTPLRDLGRDVVEQALLRLVADGAVARRALTDGTVLFFAAGSTELR